MPARAAAVAWFTLVELSRRRLLGLLLAVEGVLVAGIGLAPFVVPGTPAGEARTLNVLSTMSGVAGGALLVCAIGVGMVVIRADVDSGTIVSILARPISRLAYAGGKLASAAAVLALLDGLMAAATAGLVVLHGGGHLAVVAWFFAVLLANALIWMVVVMALTVHLHNVVAAVVAVGVLFTQGVVGELHTLVQGHVVVQQPWVAITEVGWWLLPRPLASDLEREVLQSSMRLHPGARPSVPLVAIPGASSGGDVLVWLAYLGVVCALLALAVRRKQV